MKQRMKRLTLALAGAALLSACTTVEENVARYNTLNCIDLASELRGWRFKLDNANLQGVSASVDYAIAKEQKERSRADLNRSLSQMNRKTAQDNIIEIERIMMRKGCPGAF